MQKMKIYEYESRHSMKVMFQRASISFRLITLLFIAALLQHFAFATLQSTSGFSHAYSWGTQTSYYEKGTIPHHDSQLDLFIEVESNDEDEIHNTQVHLNSSIAKSYTFEAFHYTYFINTLYLRLVSSNRHKVEPPYFVLYHSWKSDLS
ncbi:MAG TPA: hypothetical protein VJ552_03455 [Sediminibacterium sp.]|nr:hypothetical protein [Sediminibacterium sp.]